MNLFKKFISSILIIHVIITLLTKHYLLFECSVACLGNVKIMGRKLMVLYCTYLVKPWYPMALAQYCRHFGRHGWLLWAILRSLECLTQNPFFFYWRIPVTPLQPIMTNKIITYTVAVNHSCMWSIFPIESY